MTLNAPKGARREAPRPFGGVEGHQNGLKRSKKGPEKVWGPFFDIFLTSCRSPAGPQDLFLTFFGPLVGDPQKSAHGPFLDIFGRIQVTPSLAGLHITKLGSYLKTAKVSGAHFSTKPPRPPVHTKTASASAWVSWSKIPRCACLEQHGALV